MPGPQTHTTMAVGEEDPPEGTHTTMAVGEEDPPDKPKKPDVTTLAVGEEDVGNEQDDPRRQQARTAFGSF